MEKKIFEVSYEGWDGGSEMCTHYLLVEAENEEQARDKANLYLIDTVTPKHMFRSVDRVWEAKIIR